ncbi:hypothetical protein K737_300986 [Holospora undulata HU1]|uniref:Uncharacterized protein n=1 Tax=Holospora undulata HU1 TaxID=1321371 RepID=A0A061JI05_9PROT|nr:hypothetical protein K737_300986 [Holospora undulata HU1]
MLLNIYFDTFNTYALPPRIQHHNADHEVLKKFKFEVKGPPQYIYN